MTTAPVMPAPVHFSAGTGHFALTNTTVIHASGSAQPVAEYLAELLSPATGFVLAIDSTGSVDAQSEPVTDSPALGAIALTVGNTALPSPGYLLSVTSTRIELRADDAEHLFAGVQSLRQLLPHAIESSSVQDVDWFVPCVEITDYPRFSYRGAMLDVARHFFDVATVKRHLDRMSLLKLNVLHLHLTDDQGWRIHIDSWPNLTALGATTAVGGGNGGFYSKADYTEIVEFAASRYITVVPEIDVPGHTNAALSAYPELNCDDVAPAPYTGIEVGFSSLCIDKDVTYQFLDDVFREVSELTPGPYLHLGGDESLATSDEDYLEFIRRATAIAASHGKALIGWHEMGRSRDLPAGTVGQYWSYVAPRDDADKRVASFIEQGGQMIMSPADAIYLDMKYASDEELGLEWADGPTTLHDAYTWDPAAITIGVTDEHILGIEAPLWTETIDNVRDLEYMVFPRIIAAAEIAWSPRSAHDWADFTRRLADWSPRLDAAEITYNRVNEVSWPK
ncbi:putative beta-N-acetylhexosaminidase [marine actinobacterium PHSC20C1]|nr:putative beta-N-acetylhexosaminidase [marine actinobacterium PHSC20C1]